MRAVSLQLVFWNETLGDWDVGGLVRDDAAILASGDNCTFIGYSTHFTTFSISLEVNVVDLNTVRAVQRRAMPDPGNGPKATAC